MIDDRHIPPAQSRQLLGDAAADYPRTDDDGSGFIKRDATVSFVTGPRPGARPVSGRAQLPYAWLVFAAMTKSFWCSPEMLCVNQATVTLPHSVNNDG